MMWKKGEETERRRRGWRPTDERDMRVREGTGVIKKKGVGERVVVVQKLTLFFNCLVQATVYSIPISGEKSTRIQEVRHL